MRFKSFRVGKAYTITNASFPQNKNGYWSIIVCTISSKYGRICSNLPISLNSIGNNVGHQHIAKFLLSMLLSFEFSATLKTKTVVLNFNSSILTTHFTKCWKMNLRTWKFTGGSLSNMLLSANNRQLLSVLTSKLPVVETIGFRRVPKTENWETTTSSKCKLQPVYLLYLLARPLRLLRKAEVNVLIQNLSKQSQRHLQVYLIHEFEHLDLKKHVII